MRFCKHGVQEPFCQRAKCRGERESIWLRLWRWLTNK
jgi:hypothetical protein